MPQSFAQVFVHLVFSTKYRAPVIAPSIQSELHHYLAGVLNSQGCTAVQVGGIKDHVHLLFGLPRTVGIAKVVEILKTSSSKWIKTKGVEFRNFRWQSGYAVFSVSKSKVGDVRRYIGNQEEHHRKWTFQNEFLDLLKCHGIRYDDRYIWD